MTLIIVAAASLIGASTGILIAEHESLAEVKATLAAQFAGPLQLADRFLNGKSEAASPQSIPPQNTPASGSGGRHEFHVKLSGFDSIGSIRYYSQQDSTSITVDLEAAILTRAAQLRNPARICVDLQDSRRRKATMGRLKAQKVARIKSDLLTRIHVSEWDSGAMRIILDLARSCDYTCQLLPGASSSLIVELQAYPGSAPSSN